MTVFKFENNVKNEVY